ncbi:quercetin 2,3-dioxygenase [Salinirubellus salinus]|jgi:quercetin dioxygenase-like cupin family protein|uniref:Quercetin 2,3-dioxygenase n=1 Tax=Salinirubellus salinus TaxID=1364945 RepID=A0A9E7R6U5_9EURY|nr:quercetin 2,3-dioxygenase [Salinirubellus salinus]UWM56383.1 quercetin 2,3-dioxygenase [Salinirubellus salinus]
MSKTQTAKPMIRHADEGETYNIFNGLAILKATAAETNGSFGLVEQRANAGMATPLHVHHSDDELFYVVEGQVTFHVDGEDLVAGPGDTVFAPHGVPHAFRVDEDGSRWLDVREGGKEQFFADIGLDIEGYGAPPADPPTEEMQERLGRYLETYDLEILGPSPLVEDAA